MPEGDFGGPGPVLEAASARIPGNTPGLEARDLIGELRRRFSLTPSEGRIALLLADGLSYEEVAARLEVSYHTVHTHVKAIHAKAKVKSNGRLLALIRGIESE